MFMNAGDILGHEPMGIVEEVGAEVTAIKPGDRVVIPFQISCGHCFMCKEHLYTQCETTQVRDQGTGAALFGYSKLYGEVPGGQAEYLRVPQAQFTHIKVPEGPPDDRFVYLSDVLPTAWQAVEYAAIPKGGTVAVLGLGPIGEMARPHRACTRAHARSSASTSSRSGSSAPGAAASRSSTSIEHDSDVGGHRPRPHRGPRPRLGDRRGRHGGARIAGHQARAADRGDAPRRAGRRR